MESLKTKLLPPALCSLQEGAARWELWDHSRSVVGGSGTSPQLLLSAGKSCSETTSCSIAQRQTPGTAVWALICAPPKVLCFPELSADTTHLASPSTSKQATRRKAGMLWREGSSCVILHNSTILGGFS